MRICLVIVLAGLVAVIVSACASTGSYPRDFFIEMHYQRSFQSHEPPRIYPAPLAVPVSGREMELGSFQDAADLSSPLPASADVLRKAGRLFADNCAVCHGLGGRGDSPVARAFLTANAPLPTDLGSQRVKDRTPGQLYWVLTGGLGRMPPFGKLLTSDERWTLVHFVIFFSTNTNGTR